MPVQKHSKQSPVILPSRLSSANREAQVKVDTKHIIATNELRNQKGKVIAFSIYADDILTSNKFDKYFDSLLSRDAQ